MRGFWKSSCPQAGKLGASSRNLLKQQAVPMVREPQLDNSAPWKQRFRAPVITNTQIARLMPTRGLVTSNRSGIYQPYSWDVPTGELRELTDRFEGLLYRVVSPNGRYVYCFADTKGNEIGHFIRIPFEGGEVEEVTPDMPPYPTFGLGLSGQGNLLAFTIAVANEYQVYGVDISPSDALAPPRLIYRSKTSFSHPVSRMTAGLLSSLCRAAASCSLVFWLSIQQVAKISETCRKKQTLGLTPYASHLSAVTFELLARQTDQDCKGLLFGILQRESVSTCLSTF